MQPRVMAGLHHLVERIVMLWTLVTDSTDRQFFSEPAAPENPLARMARTARLVMRRLPQAVMLDFQKEWIAAEAKRLGKQLDASRSRIEWQIKRKSRAEARQWRLAASSPRR